MNLLAINKTSNSVGNRSYLDADFVALEPQGKQEWETLCPVSKLTGWPISMQAAIQLISDKNSRLAEVLYQELPIIAADDCISDDDKLNMLASRLFTGSFCENDEMVDALGKIAAEFFPKANVEEVVEKAQIQFEANDNPEVNE